MTDNVFAPPRANLDTRDGPDVLWDMTFKEVRKVYLASVNVHALGVLYALGALGVLATAVMTFKDYGTPSYPTGLVYFLAGMGILMIAATVASVTRPRWGRWVGVALCVMTLLNFPLGTLIGIIGLMAYAQGGKLFGPDRLRHKDVAAVYKLRKKDKK